MHQCIVSSALLGKNTFYIDKLNLVKMVEKSSTTSDLELFTREINWDTRPTLSKIFTPAFFGGFGFSLAIFHNLLQRRPVLSGKFLLLIPI